MTYGGGCMFVVPRYLDLPGTGEFHDIVEVFGDQTRPGVDCGYLYFSTVSNWTTIGLDDLRWCGTQQTRPARHRKVSSITS